MKYFASENKLFHKVISHFNILTKCCIFANLDNGGKNIQSTYSTVEHFVNVVTVWGK